MQVWPPDLPGGKERSHLSDYIICVDSSADIVPSFLKEHEIHVVPMSYTIGGEERDCLLPEGEEVRRNFYKQLRNGDMPHTSQVTPQQFMDAFEPILKSGKDILYISLSGGLTNTHDSIHLAKLALSEMYPDNRIYELDSLSATCGIGLLAEIAAGNLEAGMSIEGNLAYLEEIRHKVCHLFMVEDLMHLKRGGRIPPATAVLGTALNIKPILVIDEDGKLCVVNKKRGTKAAMNEMIERFSHSHDEKSHRISIIHADAPALAERLAEEIAKSDTDAEVSIEMLSPIIGAHTGPAMAAVIFFGNRSKLIP